MYIYISYEKKHILIYIYMRTYIHRNRDFMRLVIGHWSQRWYTFWVSMSRAFRIGLRSSASRFALRIRKVLSWATTGLWTSVAS